MDIEINAFPGVLSIVNAIISLVLLGLGIYLVFLLIKTLRIYIKNNS
nr:hypothetical protein [Tissierella sp.]